MAGTPRGTTHKQDSRYQVSSQSKELARQQPESRDHHVTISEEGRITIQIR